jgi:hypothetical protein
MQAMSPIEQSAFIAEEKEQRDVIEKNLKVLAKKRENYLREKVDADGGAKDSFDATLYDSITTQAKEKGLVYNEGSVKY